MTSHGSRWRPRRARTPSLEPPGVRSPRLRFDRPPDGWEPLEPSTAERLGGRMDALVIRMTNAAGRGLSRRNFLKRTGQVGLAAGLAMSGLLLVPGRATADFPCTTCNCQDPNNQQPGPCGPSPICAGSACNSESNCATSMSGITRRANSSGHWAGNFCAMPSADNCWTEPCPTGCRRCCDCCTGANMTPFCSGSGCTSKHRCICRGTSTAC